ncbi:MAG TPA: hypothetical protein VGK22_03995 [Candidatus Angelobacter sp.]
MMRKWMIAILLGSAAACGQTTTVSVSPTQLKNGPGVTVVPKVRVVQRYDKLRRGHDELVALFPDTVAACNECPTSKEYDRSLPYNEVQLEPMEGFTFHYAQGEFMTPISYDSPVWKTDSYTKAGIVNLIKISASPDVAPGNYTIRGKVVVATMENSTYNSRRVDVEIPVTVAEKNAKVHKTSWHYDPEVDRHIKSTLVSIVITPLLPILWIYFVITGQVYSDS